MSRIPRLIRRNPLVQLGIILSAWMLGEAVVRLTGLPVPGSVIGMGIVIAALASRRLSVFSMQRGADWLLTDMLLFFVPAAMAVIDHREFLGMVGLRILFVITASTAMVMLVTALIVDRALRWTRSHVL